MYKPKKQINSESSQMCLDHIYAEYTDYCKRYNIEESQQGLLQYLKETNVLNDRTLIRYFCIFLFDKFLDRADGVKTLALWEMENYLPIGWRQMTEIRKKYSTWFKRK